MNAMARNTAKVPPRRQEVLGHILKGSANKVIAHQMGLKESTVKVHIKRLFETHGVKSRTELAMKVTARRLDLATAALAAIDSEVSRQALNEIDRV